MNLEVRQLVTDLKRGLEALYGPRLVRVMLFGSWARGDAGPDSDVDVLIVLRGEVSPGEEIARTGGLIAALSLAADRVIAPVFMSDAYYFRQAGPLLRNIVREGAPV